jgi:phage terminase large subunit-like protein
MGHPAVFGPCFRGASWGAWKTFLAALFGLPMADDQLALYQAHTGRSVAPTAPFTEAELVIGRRGGKSRILALIATYLAMFRSYERYLAPGEVVTIAVIAADRKQARSIFRYIVGLLEAVPALSREIRELTCDTITLFNRVVIEIQTASFRATRGYSFAAVLADETAYWRDEASANPDVEIFRALRPRHVVDPRRSAIERIFPL